MNRPLKTRLSAMMFLEYLVMGAVWPIMSHYLKNYLGFGAREAGIILAMPAVASIAGPFVVSYIADRYVSAERLLALCHFLGALAMALLTQQTQFWPFLVVFLAYGLLFMPTLALTNAVAFHHISDAKRDFGGIRKWGTVSWVAVAWAFSFLWLRTDVSVGLSRLPDALWLSSFASLAFGVYALTLPVARIERKAPARLMPVETYRLFFRPSLLLLCGATAIAGAIHQYYYFGMAPYLSTIGMPDKYIMPAMSLGQLGEVFVQALIGAILAVLGIKRVLVIGVLAQAVRFAVFSTGSIPLTLAIIPIHGVCYAFFFTAAFIYVDTHSSPDVRSGAQQLFSMLMTGAGYLLGNLFAGEIGRYCTLPGTGTIQFERFWLVGVWASLALAGALAFLFREEAPALRTTPQTALPASE